MAHTVHALNGDGDWRQVPADELDASLAAPGRLVWIDLVDPTAEEIDAVASRLDLHPLATEDTLKRGQRPKVELYPGHTFLVAWAALGGRELAEVHLFFGDDWFMTVREGGVPLTAEDASAVRAARWDPAPSRLRFARTCGQLPTVGYLVYTVLDDIVDGYFEALDDVDAHLESLEDAIFSESATDETEVQRQLLHVRRSLLEFRRRVVPLRDVLLRIDRHEVPGIGAGELVWYQDVLDHLLRIVDRVDMQRELVASAVDAHLAMVSNRVNDIMKKMTSWGAILLGSTLIAGIYGMNFQEMPELRWQYGYFGALGSMAVLTVVLFAVFRRKRWL